MKYEVGKGGSISESIWRWLVINLVILIHTYSYLISFEITVGYRKLRSFQGPQVKKVSVLQEQSDITYPSGNSYYGISRAKLQN